MTVAPRPSAVLASTGLMMAIGSLVWWCASYGEVYAYDYLTLGQAGRCLVGESETCRLATSLCRGRHAAFAAPYSPTALWIALSLLCSSLVVSGRRTIEARSGDGAHDGIEPEARLGTRPVATRSV